MSDPNARDLRGELEDFTGEYPRSWIAKVGDVVVGRVERYSEGSTPYGRCPIVVVADEITGELMSIWLMHTVLRNEFSEQKPKPPRANIWTRSGLATSATCIRPNCPVANNNVPPLHAPCAWNPKPCCLTNQPARWIRNWNRK